MFTTKPRRARRRQTGETPVLRWGAALSGAVGGLGSAGFGLVPGSAGVGLSDALNDGQGGRSRQRQVEFVSAAVALGLSGVVVSAAVWTFVEARCGALGAVGETSHQQERDKHKDFQKNQHFNDAGDAHSFPHSNRDSATALARRHRRNGRFGLK